VAVRGKRLGIVIARWSQSAELLYAGPN